MVLKSKPTDMINPRIEVVLSKIKKDIEYENQNIDHIPSEHRLNAISENIGMFYNTLLKSLSAKKILEIGTSVGYSTLWFSDAILENDKTGKDGLIFTIEGNDEKIKKATQNFADAGVQNLISIKNGDALKNLTALADDSSYLRFFDFIFIDADKERYIEYFDLCLPMLRTGGVIGADNILKPKRFNALMEKYLDHVRRKENVQTVTVPIDNGEEITLKTM